MARSRKPAPLLGSYFWPLACIVYGMKQYVYFLECKKGVIFRDTKPCGLILLHANLNGLFRTANQPQSKEIIFYSKY